MLLSASRPGLCSKAIELKLRKLPDHLKFLKSNQAYLSSDPLTSNTNAFSTLSRIRTLR